LLKKLYLACSASKSTWFYKKNKVFSQPDGKRLREGGAFTPKISTKTALSKNHFLLLKYKIL